MPPWVRDTLCLQAQRLEELQDSLAVPYDGENLQHQQQLQELWSLAFPQLPFPAAIKSNQWKEMGWQVRHTGRVQVGLCSRVCLYRHATQSGQTHQTNGPQPC